MENGYLSFPIALPNNVTLIDYIQIKNKYYILINERIYMISFVTAFIMKRRIFRTNYYSFWRKVCLCIWIFRTFKFHFHFLFRKRVTHFSSDFFFHTVSILRVKLATLSSNRDLGFPLWNSSIKTTDSRVFNSRLLWISRFVVCWGKICHKSFQSLV